MTKTFLLLYWIVTAAAIVFLVVGLARVGKGGEGGSDATNHRGD
jgi:hypothetical protein